MADDCLKKAGSPQPNCFSRPSEIEPGLFLGGATDVYATKWLNEAKVTHILTVNWQQINQPPGNLKTDFIRADDLEYEDVLSHFDRSFEFISKALETGVILVHCQLGQSRSATIVIAYMMRKYQESYEAAFKRVQAARKVIRPNRGFILQLRLYELLGFAVDVEHRIYKEYLSIIDTVPTRKFMFDDNFNKHLTEWLEKQTIISSTKTCPGGAIEVPFSVSLDPAQA